VQTRNVFFVLTTAAVALYLNALGNEFVFDDLLTFRKVDEIKSLARLPELFDRYRPVRYLSFVLDYAISGDDPWAYHLLNSIYHGLAAFVVFVLLRRLVGDGGAALAAALVFTVHPVHTESVAYISGRRDLLTTLFYLIGFFSYLQHKRTGQSRWLLGLVGGFLLAIGAKEMAVTLPAICVLYDLLFDRDVMRRRLPFYAACFALGGAWAVTSITGHATYQQGWHGDSMSTNYMTSARLAVHYAKLFVFPLTLIQDYSYDAFPLSRSLFEFRTLGSILLLAAALAAAIQQWNRRPLFSFAILWFLITLLPVLHVVPFHELAAEHYLYLPSFAFCLLVALAFRWAAGRVSPRAAWAAVAIVCVLFGARTVIRNRDWKDSETIYRATIAAAPRCARAHLNLGVVYGARNEASRALPHMERAVEIQPDYVFARVQLAETYGRLGRKRDRETQLEEALRVARTLPISPVLPGEIAVMLRRWEEALGDFEVQIARNLWKKRALRGMAVCYRRLERYEEALAVYDKLLLFDPDDLDVIAPARQMAVRAGNQERAEALEARAGSILARQRVQNQRQPLDP
jgi:tetratricopeptide (TPR) repeat protein